MNVKQKTYPKKHTIFIYAVTLAACILTAGQSISATAKSVTLPKKSSISRSSMKMKAGAKKKLTIKSIHKKVIWSSGDRKVAVIKSKTGKYKNKAVIQAKKAGICTITVKSGALKHKCKIRVSEDSAAHNAKPNSEDPNIINSNTTAGDRPGENKTPAPLEPSPSPEATLEPSPSPEVTPDPSSTEKAAVKMTLSDIRYSDNKLSVKMTVQNNSTANVSLSRNYGFEKWEDGAWHPVLPKEPIYVTCDMILLPSYGEKTYEETCSIVPAEPLTAGTYRLVRPGIFCEDPDAVIEKTAEFVIQ